MRRVAPVGEEGPRSLWLIVLVYHWWCCTAGDGVCLVVLLVYDWHQTTGVGLWLCCLP